jgi:hypothetical protein
MTSPSNPVVKTVTVRDTVLKTDTLVIRDTIVVTKVKAHLDTVFIAKYDTLVQKASVDTTLTRDSVNVKVSYYFPPLNSFDIAVKNLKKFETRIKTVEKLKTVTIEKEPPFYKNNWFLVSVIEFLLIVLTIK